VEASAVSFLRPKEKGPEELVGAKVGGGGAGDVDGDDFVADTLEGRATKSHGSERGAALGPVEAARGRGSSSLDSDSGSSSLETDFSRAPAVSFCVGEADVSETEDARELSSDSSSSRDGALARGELRAGRLLGRHGPKEFTGGEDGDGRGVDVLDEETEGCIAGVPGGVELGPRTIAGEVARGVSSGTVTVGITWMAGSSGLGVVD
jgi:hypothetical protein